MAGDRAGLWLRVSSASQDEDNQQPAVQGYADGKGYRVVKRYGLHAKSASKGDQDADLRQVLEDFRTGMIKVLIVWKQNRLERRTVREALTYLWQVGDAGGRIESVSEGLLDENNIQTIFGAWKSREDAKVISDNTQLAYDRIKENRAFRGRDLFGYGITGPKYNRKLVVIESLRPIVVEIFQRVIDGESLADICKWLDSLGCKRAKTTSKTGKWQAGDITPWWPSMVMKLIRHTAYTGRYYVRRTDASGKTVTYPHSCEAIVTRATQRKAIEALVTREKRGPKGNPENRAMLKDVITCGNPDCDATGEHPSPMYKINGRRTEVSYRCSGRGAQRKGCGVLVPVDAVDAAVSKIMAERFAVPITTIILIPGNDWSEEIQAAKDEIRDLASLDLDDDEYDRQLAQLQAKRDELKARPAEPDREIEEETGELWSDAYAALERHERGAWMKSYGFRVQATRETVTVSHGRVWFTVAL